jgi:hypothetical protein
MAVVLGLGVIGLAVVGRHTRLERTAGQPPAPPIAERELRRGGFSILTSATSSATAEPPSSDAVFFGSFPRELRARLQHDVRATWAWVELNSKRQPPDGEPALAAQFMDALVRINPDGVIALARESRNDAGVDLPAARILAFATSALVGSGNGAQARRLVEEMLRDSNSAAQCGNATRTVALCLAGESDRAAADWVETLPSGTARNIATVAVAREWVNHDPAAAMQWATAVADAGRGEAMRQVFASWSILSPAEAAEWFLGHDELGEADNFVAELLQQSSLPHERPDIALRWAQLIREPHLRSNAIVGVLATWREHDPAAAAAYASEPHRVASP